MKIKIVYNTKILPWGGGNQFLKSLKKELLHQNAYTESFFSADAFIFNSHQQILTIKILKRLFPSKLFIHRVDGPIYKIRNKDMEIDKKIYQVNNQISDGTVFQSTWSQVNNRAQGMKIMPHEIIIMNAPDPDIFNNEQAQPYKPNQNIRLIATSWSSNVSKGFKIYRYLDEHLDFNKMDFTFIGNTPYTFKNIRTFLPMGSEKLSEQLKKHHVFITASKNDPCSNSLLEALHCGLPAVALNSGGHPEIIRDAGELFDKPEEIAPLINKVASSYEQYRKRISLPTIKTITRQYITFIQGLLPGKQHRNRP